MCASLLIWAHVSLQELGSRLAAALERHLEVAVRESEALERAVLGPQGFGLRV